MATNLLRLNQSMTKTAMTPVPKASVLKPAMVQQNCFLVKFKPAVYNRTVILLLRQWRQEERTNALTVYHENASELDPTCKTYCKNCSLAIRFLRKQTGPRMGKRVINPNLCLDLREFYQCFVSLV
jgi:hypothetical protein